MGLRLKKYIELIRVQLPTVGEVCYLRLPCWFCSSFAPEDYIRSLEIDTSDQQVRHMHRVVLLCFFNGGI